MTSEVQFSHEITVDLIDRMGGDARIVAAARVSTQGIDAEETESQGLINFLMKNRHGSPFEHGSITFRVHAPIFVFREWHRHRVGWSYNEESGRYKELAPMFYVPTWARPIAQIGKAGAYQYVEGTPTQHNIMDKAMQMSCASAYSYYQSMLSNGIAREVARMVLPVNIYSSMFATCNPRSLMHFLGLRTSDVGAMFPSTPMFEIERAARKMEEVFMEYWPMTYIAWNKNGRVCP
jgi:thymidylate synthase (FAD)